MIESTPSYSIAVPVFVLADRDISPTAKLLYGVIDSFLKQTGACYASNARLAEEVAGCSERTVSRCVSELKDAGYIKVGLLPKAADKPQVRRITLNVSASDGQEGRQFCLPPTTILSTPHDKIVYPEEDPSTTKLSTPHDKNGEPSEITSNVDILNNNIYISTQEEKEKEIKKEKENPPPKKEEKTKEVFDPLPLFVDWIGRMEASRDEKNALYLAVVRFLENREVLKKPYKSKGGVTALCNRLRRLSRDGLHGMIDLLDRATDNGWQSVYPEDDGPEAGKAGSTEGRVYEQW